MGCQMQRTDWPGQAAFAQLMVLGPAGDDPLKRIVQRRSIFRKSGFGQEKHLGLIGTANNRLSVEVMKMRGEP